MKKIVFITLLALVTALGLWAQESGFAQATFNEHRYDFGVIKEAKGPVSHTFEFTNTGDKPLIIVDVTASCGCTRPEYSTRPINPGKKGKVKVTFSPIGRPGAFHKTIKVKTNGREKRATLVIVGTVIPKGKE